MISMYDLSPYDFILLCMHGISAMLYLVLAVKIAQLKKYLKWNSHIYPRMMIASIGISVVFLSEIVAQNHYNIFFHLFMWLFALNQFAELFRLVDKYNKIEELQNKIQMKNLIVYLIIGTLFLTSCGGRKAEIEKLTKERTETAQKHREEVERLSITIKEKEQRESEQKKEIESKKIQIEKLESENIKLIEKLKEEKKDNISIKNANGTVIVTDSNGNSYQIPSGEGTEINKKSESTISKELQSVSEKLSRTQETNEFLNAVISTREKTIVEKEAEIEAYKSLSENQRNQIIEIEKSKKKNTEREAYPVYWWIVLGIILTILIQLLLKAYVAGNPIFKIFKK